MDLIDFLLEKKEENQKYFQNPQYYASLIKKRAEELLGKTDCYLFGSAVSKMSTPASDIDILIVGKPVEIEERGKIRAVLLKTVGFTSPFEIHLTTKEGFKNWYQKFIKKNFIKIS